MKGTGNKELYEAVKALNLVDEKKLKGLYEEAEAGGEELTHLLVHQDLMSEDEVGTIVADVIGLPFVKLEEQGIEKEILEILPYQVAKKHRAIVFGRDEEGIKLAVVEPEQAELVKNLQKKTGEKINLFLATVHGIEQVLNRYEGVNEAEFSQLIEEAGEDGGGGESPVTRLVAAILEHAVENKASDVHVEPGESSSQVRLRIDGILHDVVKIPKELHARIVTRIKVMAKLRTDEHQSAQDGKLITKVGGEQVDVRVSIVPVTEGEKVVMRILSASARQFSLSQLGMQAEEQRKVQQAYQASHGMILATGPTGSGKTTTLYAILKQLNQRAVNVMTIEDPVEYDIAGVNQIQVNEKTKLTFAAGLRSIVRQDPDIILVGEVRDEETAGIAVNSAMTGHLVLSTLHTNTAATTLPRLLDMGVEPFLVASTINVIVGQRLVRKICTACRVSRQVAKKELADKLTKKSLEELFGKQESVRMYAGKGCPVCHNSGYMDRVGIFEVMLMSEEIKEAVMARKNADEIEAVAVRQGMKTMLLDGLAKVKAGETTVEEVLRVTRE